MNPSDRSAFQLAPNAFPEANLPVNMRGPVQVPPGAVRPRYGLMRATIGAAFPVRCKDGKVKAFSVRDVKLLAPRLAEVRADKKLPQPHYVCFHPVCRARKWESEEALLGDHPDLKVMQQQEEAHVFALWCEAPEFATDKALEAWRAQEAQRSALAMRVAAEDPIVGLLTEVP